MARVALYLTPVNRTTAFQFVRPDGTTDAVPALRLCALVRLVALVRPGSASALRAGLPTCVVDTGAHLSIVPEYIWSQFRPGAVTPLPFAPSMPAAQRFVTVAGGRFPYELGELTFPIHDRRQRTMNLRVVAQLTRDGGALTIPLILGLRGGALDGRVVRADPDPGAPFGQAWALEDP